MVAKNNPAQLIARMADPATRIVSLTITEKGYCHTPQTGELDADHPDIVHDLANPDAPRSAPGFIVAALARRRAAGYAPFTVLSCDNLSANGHTVKRILTQFAHLRSPELGKWIADHVACPSTMVDRIVPETTDADRAAVSAELGMTDAWPVISEPFTQWIVEDNFPAGRPDFARAGVQLVADVTPFEHMKLRLLNASHSALAYLGYLAGHQTIAETMTDDRFAAFARGVMQDAAVTLSMPEGTDLAGYSASLLQRFANPALRHRTWQIAMDGSQKLPQRLLGTMQDRLRQGLPIDTHALAVAGWMRYVTASDENRTADRRARSDRGGTGGNRQDRRPGRRSAGACVARRSFDFRRIWKRPSPAQRRDARAGAALRSGRASGRAGVAAVAAPGVRKAARRPPFNPNAVSRFPRSPFARRDRRGRSGFRGECTDTRAARGRPDTPSVSGNSSTSTVSGKRSPRRMTVFAVLPVVCAALPVPGVRFWFSRACAPRRDPCR